MAVTNTGIVERNITGVNESDLWLDTEATSSVSNTGAVERSITGVHDANFVHPLGDEEITNGDFSNGTTDWTFSTGATLTGLGAKITHTPTLGSISQIGALVIGVNYKFTYEITESVSGGLKLNSATDIAMVTSVGIHTKYFEAASVDLTIVRTDGTDNDVTITDISVKEVLVSRESTAINTGVVERPITGVNESDLWLDAESTSVVNNTGIVERGVTGVNESDEMFPNNTISNIVNIVGNLISALFNAFKERVLADGGTIDNEVGLVEEGFDETASLTMLPIAYKDGALYSVLPASGLGDFNVVRGSSATRVASSGLIENIKETGSNLITNGDFSNGATDWSIEATWTIGDGVANGNGANGTSEELVQSGNLVVGKTYSITYEIKNYVSGSVSTRRPSTSGRSANGVYTEIAVSSATALIFTGVNFNGSITNIIAKEVIDDTNIPRIDYTTGEGVLLTEPQSTNLVDYSEDFTNISWSHSVDTVITSNVAVSPDGTQNADSLVYSGFGNRLGQNIAMTIGNKYALSIYYKNNGGNDQVTFTGADTTGQTTVTITNEWARYTVILTATATVTSSLRFMDTLSNANLFAWGAQVEELSYSTSYIPTSGAIATRLADVMTVDLTSFSVSSITETIDGVEQTPITSIPSIYTIPQGNINKIEMI